MKRGLIVLSVILMLFITGCFPTTLKLMSDGTEPLQEFTVEGAGKDKILILTVLGVISDQPEKGFMHSRAGLVQEVLAQLKKAEKDSDIKALVLKVDSPGGTVTASDILYNEIKKFKEKKGIPVLVSIMDVGASGGYYLSLPADRIYAHPTSITGSVGVIYMRPKVHGLMEKIGVDVEINKSGSKKDTGSPFRETTEEELKFCQNITDTLAERFVSLVVKHRKPSAESLNEIKTAAVYLPEEAKKLGLIDEIGYLEDAIGEAEQLANLTGPIRIITYRRDYYSDDTIYNNASAQTGDLKLMDVKIPGVSGLSSGFYYLCPMFSEP